MVTAPITVVGIEGADVVASYSWKVRVEILSFHRHDVAAANGTQTC